MRWMAHPWLTLNAISRTLHMIHLIVFQSGSEGTGINWVCIKNDVVSVKCRWLSPSSGPSAKKQYKRLLRIVWAKMVDRKNKSQFRSYGRNHSCSLFWYWTICWLSQADKIWLKAKNLDVIGIIEWLCFWNGFVSAVRLANENFRLGVLIPVHTVLINSIWQLSPFH